MLKNEQTHFKNLALFTHSNIFICLVRFENKIIYCIIMVFFNKWDEMKRQMKFILHENSFKLQGGK